MACVVSMGGPRPPTENTDGPKSLSQEVGCMPIVAVMRTRRRHRHMTAARVSCEMMILPALDTDGVWMLMSLASFCRAVAYGACWSQTPMDSSPLVAKDISSKHDAMAHFRVTRMAMYWLWCTWHRGTSACPAGSIHVANFAACVLQSDCSSRVQTLAAGTAQMLEQRGSSMWTSPGCAGLARKWMMWAIQGDSSASLSVSESGSISRSDTMPDWSRVSRKRLRRNTTFIMASRTLMETWQEYWIVMLIGASIRLRAEVRVSRSRSTMAL